MHRTLLCAALVLTGSTGAVEAQGRPANAFLMKIYTIRDGERNNFQPLSNVLYPTGWKAESRVQWTLASPTIPFAIAARFTSPQGTTAVEFFPFPQGVLNISPGVVQGELPADVNAALTKLAQSTRPQRNFRVLERKASKQTMTSDQGPGMANFAQTGSIRVVYEDNGMEFEEEFAGTMHVMRNTVVQGFDTRQWFVEHPRSVKAVKGKLDEFLPIGQAVCRSASPTPQFRMALQVASQLAREARQQNIDLVALEAKMWRQANSQMTREWAKVCDERWAAEQRIADQRGDILGAVHRFLNEHGREVIAPATFNHMWESNQDHYLLTNDSNFRPGPEFKGEWKQLRPKK